MRGWIVLLFAVTCLTVCAVSAAEPVKINVGDATRPPGPVVTQLVEAEEVGMVEARKRLTIRERRKLGLTFRNVLRVTRELQDEGVLDKHDKAGTAAQILERLTHEDPQAYQEVKGDFDWDAFLEFLEKLLPIILMFMEAFS
jgi:hypothetical protein